jgi:hypothetical protein
MKEADVIDPGGTRTMKTLLRLSILAGFASEAQAAQIYGTLTQAGQPVPNTEIRIVCGSEELGARTNAQGSYAVRARVTGACTLTIEGRPGASLTVYSYDDPVKYDLELAGADGGYRLRRR